MQEGLFKRLLTVLGSAFGDLADFFNDADSFEKLLNSLGWPGATQLPNSYQTIVLEAQNLRTALTALAATPSYAELAAVVKNIVQLVTTVEAVSEIPSGITDPNFLPVFKQKLLGQLVLMGARRRLPAAYHLASAARIIIPTGAYYTENDIVQPEVELNLNNLKAFLSAPTTYLTEQLGWGTSFLLDNDLQYDIAKFLHAWNNEATIVDTDNNDSNIFDETADSEGRSMLYLPFTRLIGTTVRKVFAVSMLPEATLGKVDNLEEEEDIDNELIYFSPDPSSYDELIVNLISGAQPFQAINLGNNLKITFADFSNALKFRIGGTGVEFADATGNPTVIQAFDPAVAMDYSPLEPIIFIGEPGKTRLQADGVQLALVLSMAQGVKLELTSINSQLLINGNEGDSFLGKLLSNITISVPLNMALSSVNGLRFNGNDAFSIKTGVAKRVGPVLIQQLTIGITSTERADLQLNAHADFAFIMGPLIVSIVDTGISFSIPDLSKLKDLSFGFDLPKGVGIEVISDTVTGGGYLYIDRANHKYAGVAQLAFQDKINLNALGLLQTELPGNPDAYSLLLLITATFHPIQLGLGFTLNGVGGLLGVNRATDTDYLRTLVRGGHLDQLLFPANVRDNPAAALALVDAAFPATEGRYVIGLLARLGWGTPTSLITLDVALLIELPAPVRLALLGVLEATLPSKDQDLLKLRADFLGTVDFGAKRAAFDATLSDSHLLAFALTGDLAFRFYQGQNPLFVLTAGGFHPAFQPPAGAGLTGLRRLTLTLSRGNDLRVTLTSYLAVTSNTVQFGSHLELYYRLARGLRVEGYFGFDVLFQFSPFHVQAHIEAGVAIKYGSRELLSLHLSLDVTGPGPWHLWGRASFKVWFVRIHVDVDATIGSGQTEPALPATDVQALLVTALNAATSWEVEAPKTALPGGVVLRPVGPTAARFFLDPRGALVLRQRVVPLGVPLGHYGRGPIAPNTGRRFDLTALVVAGVRHAVATDKAVETVRDFFAPDQFQALTDAEKLSLPSFQLLPCGLRLASMAGLVADEKATLRVVEYEHKLISSVSGGATTSRPPKMSARGYQQLVRGGALGQEVAAAQPSARAPQPVNWAEDTYAVVHAATLEVYEPVSHARFATQAEAEAYRQGLVAANPALAGEVLVVPAYQLELA